jgi:hypothetical protein
MVDGHQGQSVWDEGYTGSWRSLWPVVLLMMIKTHSNLNLLQVIISYCSYTWVVQLIRGVIPLWYLSSVDSGSPGSTSVISASLHSWRSRRRRQWPRDTKTVDVQTFPVGTWPETFLPGKSKTSSLVTTLKCWIIRISELQDIGWMEFCCNTYCKHTFKLSVECWVMDVRPHSEGLSTHTTEWVYLEHVILQFWMFSDPACFFWIWNVINKNRNIKDWTSLRCHRWETVKHRKLHVEPL